MANVFDAERWAAVPFHFWSLVFFVFGSIVGSFLNVCIHRMPRGESIVSPPSHCPHCRYSIPWFLNIPLATWLFLKGKCRNCRAPISARYFLVELLTGVLFLACWLKFGPRSAVVALVYCALVAGLVVATFIDFEHFIIPDEITIGGTIAGFVISLLVPALHHATHAMTSARESFLGLLVGGGLVYGILRLGKLLFGRQKISLEPGTRLIFTETAIQFPDEEIKFEDLFYRNSDVVIFQAESIELLGRVFKDVPVRLSPKRLIVGEELFDPEKVTHMEAVTGEIIIPREAMGFGDVKFMAAIGAFLGWPAVLFSLMASSMIGALVGLGLIVARRQEWSSRLPYGPYIAMGAVLWMFAGREWVARWLGSM